MSQQTAHQLNIAQSKKQLTKNLQRKIDNNKSIISAYSVGGVLCFGGGVALGIGLFTKAAIVTKVVGAAAAYTGLSTAACTVAAWTGVGALVLVGGWLCLKAYKAYNQS